MFGLEGTPCVVILHEARYLLGIQAVSELIKRAAFLQGLIPDPSVKSKGKTAEEELADFLLAKEVRARELAASGKTP